MELREGAEMTIYLCIERSVRVVKTRVLYSGCPVFKSRPADRLGYPD
jgi:hypothetical protein